MKAALRLGVALLGVLSGSVFAIDDMVCARNYMVGDNDSPCHRKAAGYEFVEHKDTPSIRVCARVQIGKFCATSPNEYRWVKKESSGDACVTDFNQPKVVNYCDSLPALYSYVQPTE